MTGKPSNRTLLLALPLTLLLAGCPDSGDDNGASDNPDVNVNEGIPDQESFSLSVEDLSVAEADREDGLTTSINVLLADNRDVNEIPDGTEIYFFANGGSLDTSCATTDGGCSVEWRSQNPRPGNPGSGTGIPVADSGNEEDVDPVCHAQGLEQLFSGFVDCPRPNRARIVAWTKGAETFIDLNSNGVFDDEDEFRAGEPPFDIPEPFLDVNENGVRDSGEPFVDFETGLGGPGSDAEYEEADGLYAGPMCSHSSLCADEDRVNVFGGITIVMSGIPALIEATECKGAPFEKADNDLQENEDFCFVATDRVGNPLSAEASVSVEGNGVEILSQPDGYPNTNQVVEQRVELGEFEEGETSASVTVEINLTSQDGGTARASLTKTVQ